MSKKQGYISQSIFRATPKPSYKKRSLVSYVFGQNNLPSFVIPLFLFLILAGIVWYSYPKTGDGDIVPVIQADPTAYRHVPTNAGGMDIAHQDSTIFEPLETEGKRRTEQLFMTEEEPLDRANMFGNKPSRNPNFKPMMSTDKPKLNLDLKLKQSGKAVEALIAREETIPVSELKKRLKNPENLEKSIGASTTVLVEKVKSKPKFAPVVKTSIVKTIPPVKKLVAVPVKKVKSSIKTGSKWSVQLGAFSSIASVKSAWKEESRKYPSILGGYDYNSQKVDRAGKTPVYRLRVSNFTTKDKAISFCSKLKAKGGNCIVTQ